LLAGDIAAIELLLRRTLVPQIL